MQKTTYISISLIALLYALLSIVCLLLFGSQIEKSNSDILEVINGKTQPKGSDKIEKGGEAIAM
jgi:hypothetical protein